MQRIKILLILLIFLALGARSVYATTNVTSWYAPSFVGDPYEYWTNAVNLGSPDGDYADINLVPGWATWHNHVSVSQFASMNIPTSADISAIQIEVKGYATGDTGARHVGFYLSRDGMTTYQTNYVTNDLLWLNLPGSATVHTYTTDTNSANFNNYNWTPDDFNNSGLTLSMYADENTQHHFYIDYIKIRVQYVSGGGSPEIICDDWDFLCKISAWFTEQMEITEYASGRFTEIASASAEKIPFAYLSAIGGVNFGDAIGTASAIPAFNLSWSPKLIQNGEETELNPVEIDIPASTFEPVQPFVTFIRGFFAVILWVSFAVFVVIQARQLFV